MSVLVVQKVVEIASEELNLAMTKPDESKLVIAYNAAVCQVVMVAESLKPVVIAAWYFSSSAASTVSSTGFSAALFPLRTSGRMLALGVRSVIGDRVGELEQALGAKISEVEQLRGELDTLQEQVGDEVASLEGENQKMKLRISALNRIMQQLGASTGEVEATGEQLEKLLVTQQAVTAEQQVLAKKSKALVDQQAMINAFHAADVNHTGRLSREEVDRMCRNWDFDALDADGDGFVCMADLLGRGRPL